MPVLVFCLGGYGDYPLPLLGREGISRGSFRPVSVPLPAFQPSKQASFFVLVNFAVLSQAVHFVIFICSHDGC